MCEPETFWTLLRDAAHWEFELLLIIVFDLLLAGLAWPFVKRHWQHHLDRDKEDSNGTRRTTL
jgi:hypothetical protein